jgi:hypothetical protein
MQDCGIELAVGLDRIDGNDPVDQVGRLIGAHQLQLAIGFGEQQSGRIVVHHTALLFERNAGHLVQFIRAKWNGCLRILVAHELSSFEHPPMRLPRVTEHAFVLFFESAASPNAIALQSIVSSGQYRVDISPMYRLANGR